MRSWLEYEGAIVTPENVESWDEEYLLERRIQLIEMESNLEEIEMEINTIEQEIERRDEEAGK